MTQKCALVILHKKPLAAHQELGAGLRNTVNNTEKKIKKIIGVFFLIFNFFYCYYFFPVLVPPESLAII